MKLQKLATIFLLFALIIPVNSSAEFTTSQISQKFSKSVVTIITLDEEEQPLSLGSGFVINGEGDIATNHHVLQGGVKAVVKSTNGSTGTIVEIVNHDPKLDLLIAKTTLKNVVPLSLGDSDKINVGEDIVAIGNPAGLEGTISKGIISGIRKKAGVKLVQITAPISPGSSGGPVFNMSGDVVGVSTAYLDKGQNLNFAMPVNYLKTIPKEIIKISDLKSSFTTNEDLYDGENSVFVHDIEYERCSSGICGFSFSLENDTSYPIRNIKIFFVYKKESSTSTRKITYSYQVFPQTVLPKLALQLSHKHNVKNFEPGIFKGYVEARVLDYDIVRTKNKSALDLILK